MGGAVGITMATRFMVTVEAPIHQKIKDHLAKETTDERSTTVVLGGLSNATRVFKNDVTMAMNALEKEMGEGIDFSKMAPYANGVRTKKMWKETGDWNDAMFSCGQAVGLINDVPTCKDLVEDCRRGGAAVVGWCQARDVTVVSQDELHWRTPRAGHVKSAFIGCLVGHRK